MMKRTNAKSPSPNRKEDYPTDDVPRDNRYRLLLKQKIQIFCFLQAVCVCSCLLTIIVFYPEFYDNYHFITIKNEDQPNESEDIGQPKESDSAHWRRVIQPSEYSKGNHTYLVYRYDRLREKDEQDGFGMGNVSMVNEEVQLAYFAENGDFMTHDIPAWFDNVEDYCDGCFVVYGMGKQVITLSNVTIYPQFGHGKVGGGDIEDVVNQREEQEMYVLDKGYFVVNNKEQFDIKQMVSNDLNSLLSGLVLQHLNSEAETLLLKPRPDMVSIVTIRHEYANFYHTTMNWYDVFLIMVLFKIQPYRVEIIWLDGHPASKLDAPWCTLFGEPIRAGTLTGPVTYDKMIWNGFGPRSHINIHKAEFLPFVEPYRHFVLNRFDIDDDHRINCRELRVTIIWRRDYVAHPRNPTGHVGRKISNEEEIWKAVKDVSKHVVVNGVQLERLDFHGQLELMSRTDILIGMHGAGLSHILYLPSTSGVIELFPVYVSPGNAHFRSMAKWRRLRYMSLTNNDKTLEKRAHTTIVPTEVIKDMVKTMMGQLC